MNDETHKTTTVLLILELWDIQQKTVNLQLIQVNFPTIKHFNSFYIDYYK